MYKGQKERHATSNTTLQLHVGDTLTDGDGGLGLKVPVTSDGGSEPFLQSTNA